MPNSKYSRYTPRWQRYFLWYASIYVIVYPALFLYVVGFHENLLSHHNSAQDFFPVMITLHFLGMFQNVMAIILFINDVYRRTFPNCNQKITWTLCLIWLGPFSWIWYAWRHLHQPRWLIDADETSTEARCVQRSETWKSHADTMIDNRPS